jgi:serine/threonine protein kinase
LVNSGPLRVSTDSLARTVFEHMLQAIDCLAVAGIVHRDLKPENILYTPLNNSYRFRLGDFGLSNRIASAETFAGSLLYMAPEMHQGGQQTHKVDVWSLFVTMLWTLDVNNFRQKLSVTGLKDMQEFISSCVAAMEKIAEMAKADPEERASAAQMLVKHFGSNGLSTPRHLVPPLPNAAKAGRMAEARPKVLRKAPATDPFRVRKARTQTKRPARSPAMRLREGAANPQTPERRPLPGLPLAHPTGLNDGARPENLLVRFRKDRAIVASTFGWTSRRFHSSAVGNRRWGCMSSSRA